ncbi:AraC family transcriptional regulator [Cellulophaga omnivescoria]|uniref:AraC family transcriptional regulator n=1 Tax=Cellulophaga omnivescoria TaxID=1888890 RepID=UPI000985F5E4|nr:AraC family transcriptional regulator [Cellulophaga omnivescoria]WBU90883.1 AraC family transcriptional regulator [Cellulophaga omnivescoria]WKB83018.1 AraC family transcriptional regulator [Cellulophaga lytica]
MSTSSEIQKHGFKEGLPQEFELVNLADLYNNFFDDLIVPHRADFYQIIWFKKGNPRHMVDFNPIDIKPNSILFVDKNSVQCFDENVAVEGEVLLFTDNFFCKTDEDTKFLRGNMLFNDLYSISTIQVKQHTHIYNSIFQFIEQELNTVKDNYQSDILRNYLQNILLLSERERQNQNIAFINKGPDLDCVIKFRDLLDKNFMRQKSVAKYTEQLNVTQKRLSAATLKVMDITPKQMIDARVILEAKRLLVHTLDSVKEIGYTLGFEEPTNFVKYFKKHQGFTPTEFRKKILLA